MTHHLVIVALATSTAAVSMVVAMVVFLNMMVRPDRRPCPACQSGQDR